jgi:hypothetical protein
LYYNQTLTRGLDLPYWLDVVAQGFFSMITTNTTVVNANKAKSFPSPETKFDFDLISFIGPFLYVFIFQLTFPVILGVSFPLLLIDPGYGLRKRSSPERNHVNDGSQHERLLGRHLHLLLLDLLPHFCCSLDSRRSL